MPSRVSPASQAADRDAADHRARVGAIERHQLAAGGERDGVADLDRCGRVVVRRHRRCRRTRPAARRSRSSTGWRKVGRFCGCASWRVYSLKRLKACTAVAPQARSRVIASSTSGAPAAWMRGYAGLQPRCRFSRRRSCARARSRRSAASPRLPWRRTRPASSAPARRRWRRRARAPRLWPRVLLISAFSRAITGAGVPAGA